MLSLLVAGYTPVSGAAGLKGNSVFNQDILPLAGSSV